MTMTEKVALSSTLTVAELDAALAENAAIGRTLMAEIAAARTARDFGRLTRTLSAAMTNDEQGLRLLDELSRR